MERWRRVCAVRGAGGRGHWGVRQREPPRNHSMEPRCQRRTEDRNRVGWGFLAAKEAVECGRETWRGLDAGETEPCGESDGSVRPCASAAAAETVLDGARRGSGRVMLAWQPREGHEWARWWGR
jgi:hypothetical protein